MQILAEETSGYLLVNTRASENWVCINGFRWNFGYNVRFGLNIEVLVGKSLVVGTKISSNQKVNLKEI